MTSLNNSSLPLPPWFVIGNLANVSCEITRPATHVSGYLANTVISDSITAPTIMTFTGAARTAGGGGYITKMNVETSGCQSPRLRLHLYNTSPSGIPDGSGIGFAYSERSYKIGYIDTTNLISGVEAYNNSSIALVDDFKLPFACAAGNQNIYGILTTLDSFTGVAAQPFYVKLMIDQN